MTTTDADLVIQVRAGSEHACRELVRRYERPVFNLIVRMVRDPGLAEDLAQETFVRMFRGLGTFDASHKFSNWLFRIAQNLTIDHLRLRRLDTVSLHGDPAARPIEERMAGDPGENPARLLERADLRDALRRALECLRPEYRQMMVLRYQEELSYEDIAEITGLPLGTVKSFLHRARAEMARALSAAGWGPRGSGRT